jgi:hypothetical protein
MPDWDADSQYGYPCQGASSALPPLWQGRDLSTTRRGPATIPSMRTIGTVVRYGRSGKCPRRVDPSRAASRQPGCCTLVLHQAGLTLKRQPRDSLLRRTLHSLLQRAKVQVTGQLDAS